MVKKVERWEAGDGSLFETELEAKLHEFHENKLDFVYEQLAICRDKIDAEEILYFIEKYTKGWK